MTMIVVLGVGLWSQWAYFLLYLDASFPVATLLTVKLHQSSASQIVMCIWISLGLCWNADLDLLGLGQGLRFWVSRTFPNDAVADGQDPHVE